jgi:NAD(P)-dependent dehydrogenase (short-subunit alcohol dehydrogenase family)
MAEARRFAIVTGSARGLGRALAVRLAGDGWFVALADLNDHGNAETLELVRQAGGDGRIEHLDVTQPEAWQSLRQRLEADWPQLDLLANNAGVAGSGQVGEFALEDWRWLLEINLYGTIFGCHAMIPWLKRNPSGAHILNTASFAGIASAPGMAAYNVSKAGVISLSETLSSELAPHRVGVTVLCPGFFRTGLLKDARMQDRADRARALLLMRNARFTAADVADAALRAMQRKECYVIMPARARHAWRLKRWLPRTFLKLVVRIFASNTKDECAKNPLPSGEGGRRPGEGS